MKITILLGAVLALASYPMVAAAQTPAPAPQVTSRSAQVTEQNQGPYEYKLVSIDKVPGYETGSHSLHVQPELIQAKFNEMSAEGWDFVSQVSYSSSAENTSTAITQVYYVFRKKKQ